MNTTIMGIDPGMTTGFATWTIETNEFYTWEVDSRDLTNVFITLNNTAELVYEDFKQRPGNRAAELYSVQVIGVIRLFDGIHHGQLIKAKYLPADAKAFWTDDKIKALGLWKSTSGGHAMDALRVLLKYLSVRFPLWFRDQLPKFL